MAQPWSHSPRRWLSIRLETLGALSAFAAAALAVEQGGAASVVGLSLSYALQITQLTNMTVSAAVAATLWHPHPGADWFPACTWKYEGREICLAVQHVGVQQKCLRTWRCCLLLSKDSHHGMCRPRGTMK